MPTVSQVLRPLGGLALALWLATNPAVSQEVVVHWRMNSLLHPKLFGEAGERFAETVRRLSDGSFVIEVHDRLVLDQDTFGALNSGLVDAVWGSAGHHHREDPALTIFTGFPFGPDPAGFTAWMKGGGGAEALEAIYARHGMKSLYCGILPAEGGGWFLAPVESSADLGGLAMRSFGYGARVLQKLGVVTYELPAEEIRPALEVGLIDAAEFSLPSIDAELGIAEVAKHLYFPGWQQPVTSLEILMPEKTWAALSNHNQAVLETACGDTLSWTAAKAAVQQVEAIAIFRSVGVELHAWPDEVLLDLREAWNEIIAEEIARDPLLAEAWTSYLRFRDGYGDWQARAYAK
ncbi:MAG: ABC transporter substrate-binding protein [Mesorhizobium sp.]|uniref:TRAP transporter substrate-binding protein n=2 Tax=Mesorhizobium TaxID=68287 RepID=UPI000FCAC714|nr:MULTISPECIES: ABC transporter substrate-binding protein [unclassified Mesorhizobium]RUV73763.1 ABC transporter substrate-binding protein [Mesorhizobium sp. M5C.F.Cr.IN.023.01.1.1]RWF85302.1 MAG: ABC transporter substrate-binding protein [Mesorhizobium sp.]RWF96185.1 MAG: ABC transporter substrate-binding protein [Mesorhizobium sp.]RWI36245.1 MAG: ABC transporter substrate-binding protein [Mesorhizobium sp.]RWI49264.1 MAG: ABC transporter substrate-binding protein [Mesorhizobium sp.]